MSYHINKKNEVDECPAKKKCRLGGISGKENHYDTREEALMEADRRNNAKHDPFVKLTKPRARTRVSASSDEVFKKLSQAGFVVSTIDSVLEHKFSCFDAESSTIDILEEATPSSLTTALAAGSVRAF